MKPLRTILLKMRTSPPQNLNLKPCQGAGFIDELCLTWGMHPSCGAPAKGRYTWILCNVVCGFHAKGHEAGFSGFRAACSLKV